jgi:hypothetical protein
MFFLRDVIAYFKVSTNVILLFVITNSLVQ